MAAAEVPRTKPLQSAEPPLYFDLKNEIRHGLATAPPAIELSGGTSSDKVLVFGGMDASIWNGNSKTLGVFYYCQQNNKPRLPPYVLLLNKAAISKEGVDPAEVFAACVKSAGIACANQFPEPETKKVQVRVWMVAVDSQN